MKKVMGISFIAIAVLLSSCSKSGSSSSLYVPTAADATANATLEELTQGRSLYIGNCGACHGLANPDDYSKSGWTSIMASMGPKTSLSSAQQTLVFKYLTRGL